MQHYRKVHVLTHIAGCQFSQSPKVGTDAVNPFRVTGFMQAPRGVSFN